jgi:hypothetical protein
LKISDKNKKDIKKKDIKKLVPLIVVFLLAYFLSGPALESQIDKMKPYLLVDPDSIVTAEQVDTSVCSIAPYTVIEQTDKNISEAVRIPVDRVPETYLPYVHYPDNWDKWYNPFNPEGKFGPAVKLVFTILLPVLILLLLLYAFKIWQQKKRIRKADEAD